MIEPLIASNLSGLAGLRHGFFTRQGGVSEGAFESLNCREYPTENPDNVLENRRRVSEAIGVAPERLLTCQQTHSAEVMRVTMPWGALLPEADAMVTKTRNIALGILTADCVPVLFADPQAGVIGAAHAGWRGALAGVVENTIAAMEELGAARANIQAAIGPCIWQDSYEVGPDLVAHFMEADETNNRFFVESDKRGHFMFDLPGYVRDRLKRQDVGGVSLSPADTCADEVRFFSYRRSMQRGEKETGRQLSVIVLTG